MDDKLREQIRLHIAGAIVRHKPPFDELKTLTNEHELSQEFMDKWVIPFFMNINHYYGHLDAQWINRLKLIKAEITTDIIEQLLGDFGWQTRHTGAFFAAIGNHTQFIDVMGTHLLKSEVCFAGGTYCKVFASFNTPQCVDYINLYLDYYLTKPDLWFDQTDAMEAIAYLDKINHTNHLDKHMDNWLLFIQNKPNWQREISTEHLENTLNVIEAVKLYTI